MNIYIYILFTVLDVTKCFICELRLNVSEPDASSNTTNNLCCNALVKVPNHE